MIISEHMTLYYLGVSQKCKDSYIVWHHFDQNGSLKFCNTQVIIVSHMPGSIRLIRGFYVKHGMYNQSLREPLRSKEIRLKEVEKKQPVFHCRPLVFMFYN